MGIFDFEVMDANGTPVSLEAYKGKVILIINSATQCGFTPQYEGLQHMYEKYKEDFIILDFPCNQFGNQAPGSNEEIATFCDAKYGITFPIFSKVEVNGENASKLFQYLRKEKGFKGFDVEHPLSEKLKDKLERSNPNYAQEDDIKWNFTKFLVDREGHVMERFEPTADLSYVEERVKELV